MNAGTLLALLVMLGALAPTPVLALNGSEIAHAQTALRDRGHDPGAIDGVMGPQTSAALEAYQRAQGLSATGRLDEATRARLAAPLQAGTAPSASPQTGGDHRPSAVDPAQSHKTGANAGEGAAYNLSSEKKGQSIMKGADPKK